MQDLQEYDGYGFFPRFGGWDFWLPRPIGGTDADSVFRVKQLFCYPDLCFKAKNVLRLNVICCKR